MKSNAELRRLELLVNAELDDQTKTKLVMARVSEPFKALLDKFDINVSKTIVEALSKKLVEKIKEKKGLTK